MTRIKALGLALVAVFALSAVGAGAASAAEFHSTSASTKITATQTNIHKFTSTAGEVTCENATFTGTQATSTASSVSVSPSYSGCHIIFFGSTISATIANNGCTYTLLASGTANVVCGAEKFITVTGAGCTIKVGSQNGLKSTSYKTNGNHVDITANLSGISYSHSGFTCGSGSGNAGTYTGTTTASGTDTSGKAVSLSYF